MENDTDTGIYISEKQVYEAMGIRPDSEDKWTGEVIECDNDDDAIALRVASLKNGSAASSSIACPS